MSVQSLSAPPGCLRPAQPIAQSLSGNPLPARPESNLWGKLRGTSMDSNGGLINPETIDSQLNVACPANTAVRVRSAPVPIHANVITFVRKCTQPGDGSASPTDASEHIAKAGQSPQRFDRCAMFLVEGLDSGQGLFQFVSRKTHAASIDPTQATTRERSIIDQLMDEWTKCGKKRGELVLAGRYEVTQVEPQAPTDNHRRVMLTVWDRENSKTITVPLTQAGLRFTGQLLRWEEIKTANTLLDGHRDCVDPPPLKGAADPMIISFAGIGRNAALITYRETRARIDAQPPTSRLGQKWLDETLKNIVESGRRDRGPGFIHSDAQLEALREGFQKVLDKRNQSVASAQSPGQAQEKPAPVHPIDPHHNHSESPRPQATPGPQPHRANNQLQPEPPKSEPPAQQSAPTPQPQPQSPSNQQQLFAACDVSSKKQLALVTNSGYKRQLKDQSVDLVLVSTAQRGLKAQIDDWRKYLVKTHEEQGISGTRMLCWVRSSWLSAFAMLSPAALQEKLRMICDLNQNVNADAPILSGIAQRFQADPAAFMLGERPSATDAPRVVDAKVREAGAVLGPEEPLSQLVDIQSNSKRQRIQMGKTPESFLQQLQCEIAAAYRPNIKSDPQFMAEIEILLIPDTPATSNLPVSLHRALGLPVLVIETGSREFKDANGAKHTIETATLRVSAPNGTELANIAEEIAEKPDLSDEDGYRLLEKFNHLAVIWLHGGHYTVYLPNCLPAKPSKK